MADSQAFADFAETMAKKGAEALVEALRADPQACDLLERVLAASPYLSDLAVRHPQALKTFLLADPQPRLEAARQVLKQDVLAADSDAAAMRLLRLFKQELALGVALGDLSGRLSVDLATAVLSEGAEAAIQAAAARALAGEAALGRYHPEDPADPEKGSGYIVLAMGKLGARELNYSSDIDLIVFFDGAKARLKEGLEASPFFVRLTQKVVKLLQERTADGYVFRTDLRLRPDPGATAVAVNIDSALTYYESLGRTWERAAMIKARAVAGDLAAGEAVLAQIAPFVWRRYLDYAAIADIHAIKRSINTHKGFGTITVPGHDLKLGRGGIREIEFFVQTQQLIAGGRNRSLRHRSTVVMLDRFAEGGWIAPETAEALKEDYRFLRRVEHAVQMLRDEQTHRMPHDEEGRRAVATLLGETDPAAFEQRLAATMQRVHGHFTRLFERGEAQEDGLDLEAEEVGPEVLQRIAEFGFQQPVEVVRSFKGLFAGNCNATRVAKSRDRLRALVPALLKAFGATDHPDQAMAAFERFVRGLPAGVQLFSLLANNPSLLDLLARIMGLSPRLADFIARRPNVLDAVLDPAFFGALPSGAEMQARIDEELALAEHFEDALDRLRIVGQEQQFLIGVRLIGGALRPAESAEAYTALADVLISGALKVAEDDLALRHGHVPGASCCVLAMGKLGGREMTAASDLDLILIYDVPEDVRQSDGERPLAPTQWFQRLTQRLIAALSAPTAKGMLYEVDFRLRPSGNSGPLATSLKSFAHYQANEAWTWEHQALTRARPIGGPQALRSALLAVIGDVLGAQRDADKVKADVVDMRRRIAAEKHTNNPFDFKQVPGGQVDVEFIAQGLQLINAHAHPGIVEPRIVTVFDRLSEAGVIGADDAALLKEAAGLYRDLTQVQRLCLDGPVPAGEMAAGVRDFLVRTAGVPDMAVLEAQLGHTQEAVRACFERLLGAVHPPDEPVGEPS